MKVILRKTIHKLGKENDLIVVKDGYARNYLIPNELAMEATKNMQSTYLALQKHAAHKELKMKDDAKNLAERLSMVTLDIKSKAGTKGKVYGAVNAKKISEALLEQGVNVDKHNIFLSNDIKDLGLHTAKIKLFGGIECELKFNVTPA